jgi:hypothetical protein
MRRASIVLAMLATTLAGSAPQGATAKGPNSGRAYRLRAPAGDVLRGQTIDNLTDQFAVGFPVGITVKGPGRVAFDLELVPTINTKPRQTTLAVHPGLVWNVGREDDWRSA